ncbi:MAG: carboxymuconolactone decarboxylase family protein [Planctomycetia bacterium]|nr:carboxymuconolactone decarboxylase family protein [Planctomycetia bacterium]
MVNAQATVATKPLSTYPWLLRLLFWKQKRSYGRVLHPALLWGRSPRVFTELAILYAALDRRASPLAPGLRSLLTVGVSQINQCAFCVDINSAKLAERGVPMEKIDALADWRDSVLFLPEERLALEYAEAITFNQVDDDLRQRLKRRWDDDVIVELTGLIAFQNLSSKFNAALAVPPTRILPDADASILPINQRHDRAANSSGSVRRGLMECIVPLRHSPLVNELHFLG